MDQVDPQSGKFDEHKVLLGFNSVDEAKKGYLANYEKGWKGLGGMVHHAHGAIQGMDQGKHHKTAFR